MQDNTDIPEYCIQIVDDVLDEGNPGCTVAGIEFSASQILKQCDPVSYRQVLLNFVGTLGDAV